MLIPDNNAARIKRQLAAEVVRLFRKGTLEEEIDSLPIRFIPREQDAYRCCIYKDRAMVRLRLLAALGFRVEEDDEARPLSDYAREALQGEGPGGPVLTVLDTACRSCSGGKHRVTELCQGCLARPCLQVCPRRAIRLEQGRSVIDEKLCINCGKCREVCPYSAIVQTKLPCAEACPVGAIKRNDEGRLEINHEDCVSCGHCTRACPFGAATDRSQLIDVLRALRGDQPVAALAAPSMAGQFGGSLEQTFSALGAVGFDSVHEVSHAAGAAALLEAREWGEAREEGRRLATSCCPAYVETVKRHIPSFLPAVSGTPSPMAYAAERVKKARPEMVTVFIGPCVAKKREALDNPMTDLVLTFEEAGALFMGHGIDVSAMEETPAEGIPGLPLDPQGLLFPRAGGVAEAVTQAAESLGLPARPSLRQLEGLGRKNQNLLKSAEKSCADADFIEVMMCQGGCVNGPGTVAPVRLAEKALRGYRESCLSRMR